MAASDEQRVLHALHQAKTYRGGAENAAAMAMTATISFMDAAREAAWAWDRIGPELEITPTAARRYYERNRRRVRNGA